MAIDFSFKMNKKTIGDRVRFLRDRKSLAEFGSELGVSPQQISRIETDQSKPSIDLATKICEVYKVSLDWLFGLSEETNPTAQLQEPKSDMMYISKDEYIELQRKALQREEEKNRELSQKIKELKNDQ